ncbi:hypothetical protein AALO_G00087780 [Alosa alosa]|uniref:Band 3 cytoplasmic domain-containing protein n=1 Tax=Alosa alosa TaxID=278164 RepID=A0AAV6GZ37_9TELE|nr:hypothetical protein AALO_G00087780 [Alosa alosa]
MSFDTALNVNTNANTGGVCQAYVELNELMGTQGQAAWQETARWVGHEENYDPEAGRWGQSHVSYLTFKSLVQLRRTLNTGVVLLDMKEKTLASIMEKLVDEMANKKAIDPSNKDGVLNILLQNRSSPPQDTQPLTVDNEMKSFSVADRRDASENLEASMVLVGALDFLDRPVVAFVRLKEAEVLEAALEAPVPVRFLFVLIGPTKSDIDYHETGRAMAALMADRVFNQAVLQVQSECELTDAVADFMDCSVVIPPTEIQSEAMLHSLIGFQRKLLQDRLRLSDPQTRLERRRSSVRKVSIASSVPPPRTFARRMPA